MNGGIFGVKGAIHIQNGPQTDPKRPQTGPDGPRTCTTGVWWPYLGTESTWATCETPFGHVLPVSLPNGVIWPPKMGLKMVEIEFFLLQKMTLDHLGCSKTRILTPFLTVLRHCWAPKGLQVAHPGTKNVSKIGRKCVFSGTTRTILGVQTHILSPF